MTALPTVLVVDDEPHSVAAMRMALEDEFAVIEATDAAMAIAAMEDNWVQVIVSDQRMPGRSGIELLTEVRDRWPDTVRMILTGYTEPGDMIAAINAAGIYQFITKPWHPDQLVIAVRNAARLFQLARDHERMTLEMRYLGSSASARLDRRRRALAEGLGFERIVRGPNSCLNPVIDLARQVAGFDVPVLLCGEAGTGKAALARAIHHASLRADGAFHQIDCAGIDDATLAAELFGARKGGGGAPVSRPGLLQKAGRGTLYLAGVDTLSPAMQLALLRVAREGAFQAVGGAETLTTEARLIAGAHRDLRGPMADGRFRVDLFYALAVSEIAVPPLRARRGDVALIAERMLHDLAGRHGKPVKGLTDAALGFLEGYDWPGNLPELENEVTRMLILAQDHALGPELIGRHILQADPSDEGADRVAGDVAALSGTLRDRTELMERRILRETLTRLKWNKSRAAAELGLSRVGLRAKLDRHGLRPSPAPQED